jgi:hypothetical protein
MSMKNSNDTIGNQTRDLPTCRAVLQPTALPRAPDKLYRLIYYSTSALHISGDVFAHHQEHLTVFTVSGYVHPSYCRLQPAATWVNTTRYFKCSQVLLMMGENIAPNM